MGSAWIWVKEGREEATRRPEDVFSIIDTPKEFYSAAVAGRGIRWWEMGGARAHANETRLQNAILESDAFIYIYTL